MSDASKIPGNLLATKVDPPGPATWISHKWRMFIAELLTCLMNPHITLLYLDESGAATLSKDAEIVMGPAGWTATFDLTGLGGSGGGSGTTVQEFTIATSGTIDAGDYYNTTTGTKIAKSYKMRCVTGPASDSIRGVTYTYTYAVNAPYDEYARTTSGSDGSASTDLPAPPALAGDKIYAANIPGVISGCDWVELTERKWASAN